jgi:hypothetical protein
LRWDKLATSVVTEVELPRAVARAREDRPNAVIDGSVVLQSIFTSAAIVPLGPHIISGARGVAPVHVGAPDAIHVARARSFGSELAAVATYDKRMQNALALTDIEILAPA